MRIPPEKIDDVRNATDIVDLIGSFVKLKKRGKNYVGLCPFHTEKTPSFNVSPERQMYHCFGCGVGGNAITFVMEYEKVSFVEAVRSLAEKAGITLPTGTAQDENVASEQEELYRVCRDAGLFFHKSLTETTEGKLALEYLRHRGYTDETIRTFGLGYAPGSWEALVNHFREKNVSMELLAKAGLARKREDGSFYDYFRGRAMFPVFSTTGRILGFGARKMLEDDPLGKYINSPETPIYNKSRILYGIYQSKEAIRENENAILVEGYADLITVYQSGTKNVVASSGTALTQEQIQLIGRYARSVTIVYDADTAGIAAASRGVELIVENGLDVRVVVLPEGEDPDSFVKKHGGEEFRKLIHDAISFIDFIAVTYESAGKLGSPEGQAETVRAIVSIIAKMSDELKQNFYIKHVAEKYKLYESTLHRELEKMPGGNRRQNFTGRRPASVARREPDVSRSGTGGQIPVVERDLIHAMLDGGKDIVTFIFDQITIDNFTHPLARAIAAQLLQQVEEGEDVNPTLLMTQLEDPLHRRLVAEIIFSKYQLSKGWSESQVEQANPRMIAADALLRMRRMVLDQLMKENHRLMKEAGERGENTLPYLQRNNQLVEELTKLKSMVPAKTE